MSRCLVRVSVEDAFHTAGRSRASWSKRARSIFGRVADTADSSSIRRSSPATCSSASFQRASSSRATWRLAGSTRSYRREARDAS